MKREYNRAMATSTTITLVAGGVAGTSVDIALFPIDTIKTRLQVEAGFLKSGGFRGIYNGVGAAALGAAPNAALFFLTYESLKPVFRSRLVDAEGSTGAIGNPTFMHAVGSTLSESLAASCGEVVACTICVPTENIKQRMQVNAEQSMQGLVRSIYASRGISGFYTGYGTTVAREVPFSFIQLPIWERLKRTYATYQGRDTTPVQGAGCGAVAGMIAGTLTNPLDVIKTRLMTEMSSSHSSSSFLDMYRRIVEKDGVATLLRGIGPRTTWIGLGGFVYFGVYEGSKEALREYM